MVLNYLLQKNGSCCSLYALINAGIYHGLQMPEFGSSSWGMLVDIVKCRHGSALRDGLILAAGMFDMELSALKSEDCWKTPPAVLAVMNPEPEGMTMHDVLVIGGNRKQLELVNYHWKRGPVQEVVFWSDIELPIYEVNRTCYQIVLR